MLINSLQVFACYVPIKMRKILSSNQVIIDMIQDMMFKSPSQITVTYDSPNFLVMKTSQLSDF